MRKADFFLKGTRNKYFFHSTLYSLILLFAKTPLDKFLIVDFSSLNISFSYFPIINLDFLKLSSHSSSLAGVIEYLFKGYFFDPIPMCFSNIDAPVKQTSRRFSPDPHVGHL